MVLCFIALIIYIGVSIKRICNKRNSKTKKIIPWIWFFVFIVGYFTVFIIFVFKVREAHIFSLEILGTQTNLYIITYTLLMIVLSFIFSDQIKKMFTKKLKKFKRRLESLDELQEAAKKDERMKIIPKDDCSVEFFIRIKDNAFRKITNRELKKFTIDSKLSSNSILKKTPPSFDGIRSMEFIPGKDALKKGANEETNLKDAKIGNKKDYDNVNKSRPSSGLKKVFVIENCKTDPNDSYSIKEKPNVGTNESLDSREEEPQKKEERELDLCNKIHKDYGNVIN